MRRLLRMLGLAEYGGDELLIGLLACGGSAYALTWVHPALALLPLFPLGIVLWFFRDPQRHSTAPEDILLAPADGTVADITELQESEFIGGAATRIGIFLSPFNVHVNRSPGAGTVLFFRYRSGEFLPAYNPNAPERNESASIGVENAGGVRVLVKQITGILARRIVCEARIGQHLARGQRYGMIKFGSRTELYVPQDVLRKVLVKIGDSVRGGETPCCMLIAQSRVEPAVTQNPEPETRTPAV